MKAGQIFIDANGRVAKKGGATAGKTQSKGYLITEAEIKIGMHKKAISIAGGP